MENKVNELNDQEIVRREKLDKYKALGIDPFGKRFNVSHHSDEIRKLVGKKNAKSVEKLNLVVSFAGRVMAIRRMGKASFMKLQDKTGFIQVYM